MSQPQTSLISDFLMKQNQFISFLEVLKQPLHELHPELANGFRPEIYTMLDAESQGFYTYANDLIESGLLFDIKNFSHVINPLFFILENEVSSSLAQLERWYHGVPMPEYYLRPLLGKKIRDHGRDANRSVEFNKVEYENGLPILQAQVLSALLNCLEAFWEKNNIVFYEKGNNVFLEDFRKIIYPINHLRHFQHPIVPYDQIILIKESLEELLNKHLPLLNTIKLELNGTRPFDFILKVAPAKMKANKNTTIEILDESAD